LSLFLNADARVNNEGLEDVSQALFVLLIVNHLLLFEGTFAWLVLLSHWQTVRQDNDVPTELVVLDRVLNYVEKDELIHNPVGLYFIV
jgi:hypothetical protein